MATLVVASLVVPAATDAGTWTPRGEAAGTHLRHMSVQQKRAVIQPLVTLTNQCIARKVSTDPRLRTVAHAGEVNDLIVDSVPSCLDAVRAMMDAHDRLFGEGAGETFFSGPYLDALPEAIHDLIQAR